MVVRQDRREGNMELPERDVRVIVVTPRDTFRARGDVIKGVWVLMLTK